MICEVCGTTLRIAHGSMRYCDSCQQWRTTSRATRVVCDRCGEWLHNEEAVVGVQPDGKEVFLHEDRDRCKYFLFTDPDTSPILRFKTVVGRTFDEPRMTGALDPERGWWR